MAESPFLVVGLGNPGSKYENTPHNIGFRAVDVLATRWDVRFLGKYEGQFGEKDLDGQRIFLLKPLTFMNLSGRSVSQVATFFKVPPEQTIVVSDDIDLPPGALRLRKGGGPGGHNGLRSIIECTGSSDFLRVRIGVGRDPQMPPDRWVLSKLTGERLAFFEKVAGAASEAIEAIVKIGIDKAMNSFNRKVEET